MRPTSLHFSTAARALTATARRLGLEAVPTFRSPPRSSAERTIQRHGAGAVTVAVRLRGRPWPAVLADMVDGVVAANELDPGEAGAVRGALWSALALAGAVPGGEEGSGASGAHAGGAAA